MSTKKKLTRKGARNVTVLLDRIASLVQENPELLGIHPRIAKDYAFKTDIISDAIEKRAMRNFPGKTAAASNGGWDPAQIGETKPGPDEMVDPQEPWMNDKFTQQWFEELGDKQDAGLLQDGKADEGPMKLASRVDRIERILVRLATEEDEGGEEEAKKKAGEEEGEEEEEGAEEAKKKSAGFNLFEE